MTKFQRRHYELLAEVMAYSNANDEVINQMVKMLERDNYRFDETRFRNAIYTYGVQYGI
tara:strand:+ start:102 stop:278 length:177 start_codon:yes stop_codon:yes gene_type:complete